MYSNYLHKHLLSNDPLLSNQVIQTSLNWILEHAEASDYGIYKLGHPEWFVNVHSYDTIPEEDCQWENHRQTVDIQYTIAGEELIKWKHTNEMEKPTVYKAKADTEFYEAQATQQCASLVMSPGRFAIFFPGDAHCPKIKHGRADSIKKLVVKIPFALFI